MSVILRKKFPERGGRDLESDRGILEISVSPFQGAAGPTRQDRHQRSRHHRERGDQEHEVGRIARNQTLGCRDAHDDERELASLAEHQPRFDRGVSRQAE